MADMKTIGVLTPALDSTTLSRIMTSLTSFLFEKGFEVMLFCTDHGKKERTALKAVDELGLDAAVVLAAGSEELYDLALEVLDFPLVFVGKKVKNGYCITYDDYMAGCAIGEYLTACGDFEDYLYIGMGNGKEAAGKTRLDGLRTALKAKGIDDFRYLRTDYTLEKASDQIHAYLQKHIPEVIICGTDTLALACYKELNNLGLRIPEDVSVAGFGSHVVTEWMTPGLTMVRYPDEMAGYFAGDMVVKLLNGETVAKKDLVLDYQLIERESVKTKK